jgi:putative endonuclease
VKRDKKYYIGYTSDLRRRMAEHENGSVDSTKERRPMKLIYYEAFADEKLAREREHRLKQFGSAYKALMSRLNTTGG